MINDMINVDTYSLKARIYPCSIVLMPGFLLLIYYVTDIELYYHYISSFIGLGVFSFLLAQLGRDNGKRKEVDLYKSWGGKPSILILRHSNNHLDVHTKNRFHRKLEELIAGIKIPTAEEEQEDLEKADSIYESCSRYLISKTRDIKKHPLLYKENINYGFRRNLWGMKALGIILIAFCMLIHLFDSTKSFTSLDALNVIDLLLFIIFIILLAFWLLIVNKEWVRLVAFEYAERLHEILHH